MPNVTANGIQIEYETLGTPAHRPLLLIMGLGAQLIHWDDEFCQRLVERGHFVIRFDNRDIGLSSKLDHLGQPDSAAAMARRLQGETVEAPYLVSDMAADCGGLLDALSIEAAHVVGASLGGMIAQTLAIEDPSHVLSLTSIMSSTGNSELPPATPEAVAALLSPLPTNRDQAMDRAVRIFRTIGSPGFPFDEPRVRDRAARAYDRAFHPAGVARQLVAALASGARTELLSVGEVSGPGHPRQGGSAGPGGSRHRHGSRDSGSRPPRPGGHGSRSSPAALAADRRRDRRRDSSRPSKLRPQGARAALAAGRPIAGSRAKPATGAGGTRWRFNSQGRRRW